VGVHWLRRQDGVHRLKIDLSWPFDVILDMAIGGRSTCGAVQM
jgi:hypothetical protein